MRIMNRSALLLLIVFQLINLAQSSLLLNQLNQQCLCDITNQCDNECCCDEICDSRLVSLWKNYNYCLDDNFGIPFCSKLSQTDVNVLDLHSGLRTIYSVIKRLFCITSVNFVQPSNWYQITPQQNDIDTKLANLQTVQSQSIFNDDLLAQTQFAISGLPLKSSNGLCRSSSQLTKNTDLSSSCRVFVSNTTNLLSIFLSTQKLQSFLGVTLLKYDTTTVSTGAITSQSLTTNCLNSTYCQNVIRQVRIFINSDNGSIITSMSYVVVGPLTLSQTGYININYQYQFITLQNNVPILPYSSKIGYEFGSPINLLYQTNTGDYYKIFTPLNLAYRQPNGNCRTSSTDPSSNSFIDFKFGHNQAISCYGSTNLIYNNLKQTFNYVGKYGTSSTMLSEYINVTFPSNSIQSSESVQIVIYYINVGIPQHPQYEISEVVLLPFSTKDGLSTLFIEFISVDNTFDLYVPPAPTANAYLPNDFLYPFFVA